MYALLKWFSENYCRMFNYVVSTTLILHFSEVFMDCCPFVHNLKNNSSFLTFSCFFLMKFQCYVKSSLETQIPQRNYFFIWTDFPELIFSNFVWTQIFLKILLLRDTISNLQNKKFSEFNKSSNSGKITYAKTKKLRSLFD